MRPFYRITLHFRIYSTLWQPQKRNTFSIQRTFVCPSLHSVCLHSTRKCLHIISVTRHELLISFHIAALRKDKRKSSKNLRWQEYLCWITFSLFQVYSYTEPGTRLPLSSVMRLTAKTRQSLLYFAFFKLLSVLNRAKQRRGSLTED